MRKRILLLLLFTMFLPKPTYGHDLSHIGEGLPCVNSGNIARIIKGGLTLEDYGGIYASVDGLHIRPIHIDKIEKQIKRAEIELNCDKLPIIMEETARYSVKELKEAQDRIGDSMKALGLNSCGTSERTNSVTVSAFEWTEEKKRQIMEIAGIDSIDFETTVIREPDYSLIPLKESYAEAEDYLQEPVTQELSRQIFAGKLWMNREKFSVSMVDATQEAIQVTVYRPTEQKKAAILDYAQSNNYHAAITFLEEMEKSQDLVGYSMKIMPDKNYVIYKDSLAFVMKNKPYMKDGYIMLPIRDLYEVMKRCAGNTNFNRFSIKWIGGEDMLAEFNANVNIPVQISVTNNLLIVPYAREPYSQALEGRVEIIDGVLYVPYTNENTRLLLSVGGTKNQWNPESQILMIWI